MLISNQFTQYKQAIRSLPGGVALSKEHLLVGDFLMAQSGALHMYYAPHNEYIRDGARICVIGLTPGWSQMRVAMQTAKASLAEGLPDEEVCRRAKEAAAFAGTMRLHLIGMLDALELHRHLGVASCGELFGAQRDLLHTTSLLRYPVFVGARNYSGAHPPLLSNPFLTSAALDAQQELGWLPQALIIPLGKTVEQVLRLLVRQERLDAGRILWGFPHPSGANGHRQKQFAEQRETMRRMIETWFQR